MNKFADILKLPTRALTQSIIYWTEHVVFPRPRTVVGVAAFCTLVLAVGVLNINVVTESDRLWVPQETQIMKSREWVTDYYGPEPTFVAFILEGRDGSILNPAGIRELFAIRAEVQRLESYKKACFREGDGECSESSVTSLWCDEEHFESEVMRAPAPQAALLHVLNTRRHACSGKPLALPHVLAEPSFDETGEVITGAHLLKAWLFTADNEADREAFEADYKTVLLATQERLREKYGVYYIYYGAFDEEILRSINGDVPLVVAAFVLISVGTILTQMDVRQRAERSMMGLACWGMASVAMSVAAAYGLVIAAGVPFTSLAQIGPFIFLGIGVDDVIVMLESLRTARAVLRASTARARVVYTMSHAGISISVTSATNFLAFALGSFTVIPAVRWFCLYAAVAIVADFVMQVSFFLAILILHETARDRCAAAGAANDVHPIVASPRPPPNEVQAIPASPGALVEMELVRGLPPLDAPSTGKQEESSAGEVQPSDWLKRGLERYADVLMLAPVRAAVFAAFIGYAAVCVLGEPQLQSGLPSQDLAPDESFMRQYLVLNDGTFEAQTGESSILHFHGLDHASPRVQASILASWALYLENEYVQPLAISETPAFDLQNGGPSPHYNWLTGLLQMSANHTVPCRDLEVEEYICEAATAVTGGLPLRLLPEDRFPAALARFLTAYPSYNTTSIAYSDGKVMRSSLAVSTVPSGTDESLKLRIYRASVDLDREINRRFFPPSEGFRDHTMFTYAVRLVYWQQEAVLWDELILNLSLAGSGVFIVSLLVLVHPAALLATTAVGVVDLFLFGTMFLGGIRFNVISVVNLVMAVGLAVDYTLHFMHTFLMVQGADQRASVRAAMGAMGYPIFLGAFTTLLGTLPMAFSSSTIFRTFFALLFSTIVYAISVGLVLLPAVLATIPLPKATHLHDALHDGSADSTA